ncbi:MAG: diguanylate cyclase, partial [Actinomycetota bacterium]
VEGYGTYHLKARVDPEAVYGIKLKNIATAYELYVGNRLVSSSGQLAKEAQNSRSRLSSDIAVFRPRDEEVDIILQVSSFSYYRAGINETIKVGNPQQLQRSRHRDISLHTLLSGIILALSVYHLLFFIYRKRDRAHLYFSIAGFLIFMHTVLEANKTYGLILPSISLQAEENIQTVLLMLVLPAVISSLYHIFNRTFSRHVLHFFSLATLASVLAIIILPFSAENPVWPVYGFIIFLGAVFVLYVLVKNIAAKNFDALIILLGAAFFISAIIHDFLIDYGLIDSNKLFYAGWVLFLSSISVIIARQFSNSYRRVEILSGQLNKKNIDLKHAYHEIEKRVEKRTDELNIAKRKLEKANEQLKKDKKLFKFLSITDGLTKLYNHSHITYLLEQEISRSKRYGNRFSVFMMDVDYFKAINDTYGHQAGDRVLKDMGMLVRSSLRKSDIAGRYGGEEFLIIMPETDLDSGFLIGERLRIAIEKNKWDIDRLRVTVSGGIVEYDGSFGYRDILNRADNLLYRAKEKGRNRIEK